ncbi:MAG TPA: 3'-5' exonuclease [Polyangiales bacterium]|nr:3'-5' exonuclease [Polyangiales bacterium]
MRGVLEVCGCFPTGRHYPGIAERLQRVLEDVPGLAPGFDARVRWSEQRLAVIDFETTGLVAETDRVIEIGVSCFEAGRLTLIKNWLINPGIPIPEESRAVHNITDEELANAPSFAQVAVELAEVLRGHIPVAYNAAFDRGFLQAELGRLLGVVLTPLPPAFLPDVVWVDPLVWVRELFPEEKSRRLADISARLGIALENAHRAGSDAEAAGRVLLALAERMPRLYAEVISLQARYAARQDLDFKSLRRR